MRRSDDLENMRSFQLQALNALNSFTKEDISSFSPLPVAILSFFVLPFQALSNINFEFSYWIGTILNLVVLIGYLVFFLRNTNPGSDARVPGLKLLMLMLISFPVFKNIIEGQVNVFLLVCIGEFIRNAVRKKPVLSGVWLGGLLLKPQVLILIIPILLIMRHWKVLIGFAVSSSVILLSSIILSGFAGMQALINLLTKYSAGIASNTPGAMINWRMVGVNLNLLLNTTLGWVITGLGIILTLLAVYWLVKHCAPYGSSGWVVTMLGVFAGTLAITWHSHYHMAMVLIPFLIYVSANKLLPEKIPFLWVSLTPIAWFGMVILSLIFLILTKINIFEFAGNGNCSIWIYFELDDFDFNDNLFETT